MRWCYNKRVESDLIVDWMVKNWGLELLCQGSGVIDIGGEPGFVASSLIARGIPVTVVDPCWAMTGKVNKYADINCDPKVTFFKENFDQDFWARNQQLVESCSAVVSLYGDEATEPCLQVSAALGKPCLCMPCNECLKFFPPEKQTYDAYVQRCMEFGNQQGGRFEVSHLYEGPFSRALVVQSPLPDWAPAILNPNDNNSNSSEARNASEATLTVPIDVLRDLGILHQTLWRMELASQGKH